MGARAAFLDNGLLSSGGQLGVPELLAAIDAHDRSTACAPRSYPQLSKPQLTAPISFGLVAGRPLSLTCALSVCPLALSVGAIRRFLPLCALA